MTPFTKHVHSFSVPNGPVTWIIGDVHGCGLELEQFLKEKVRRGIDSVYCVGDMFDRGMHGALVWRLIFQYRIVCVLGNHEIKLLKFIKGTTDYIPKHYHWCRAHLNENGVSDENLVSFIGSMPSLIVFREQETIVTHGGVSLETPREPHESANSYGSFNSTEPMPSGDGKGKICWWDHYKGPDFVIYGHIVTAEPRIRNKSIGIDTACVHGYKLTGYCLETEEIHSVPAQCDWFAKLKGEAHVPDDRPPEFQLASTLKSD